MKPTWALLKGSTFSSWGWGRKGEWVSSSFLHSRERDFLQERCQGSKGGMGWYYPSPPSLHPHRAAQPGHFSAFAWAGVILSVSVLIEASTYSLFPLCCGWCQKLRAQGWIHLICTRRGILKSQGPTMAGTLLLVFYIYIYIYIFFFFNWLMIALQYWFDFCHTSTWISHRCTYVPSLLNLSASL